MNDADALLLARYLDDDLSPEERAALEARLAAEPSLRAELEVQRRIDAALQGRYAEAPDPAAVLDRAQQAPPPRVRVIRPAFAVVALLAAAAVLLALLPLFRDHSPTTPEAPVYQTGPPRPLAAHYAARLAAWKPDWVCKTDAEFRETFAKRLGQALTLKASAQVRALGLAYVNGLSPKTIALLGEADGQKLMVFVDRAKLDRTPKLPEGSTLHVYRRQLGPLVAYEISPLTGPKLLELLSVP